MNRLQFFSSVQLRHYSLCQRRQPYRSDIFRHFASLPNTGVSQHKVKCFDELPGPKPLANISGYIRKGGLKNLNEIQKKKFETFGPIFVERIFGKTLVHVASVEAINAIFRNGGKFPLRDFVNLESTNDSPLYSLQLGTGLHLWRYITTPAYRKFLQAHDELYHDIATEYECNVGEEDHAKEIEDIYLYGKMKGLGKTKKLISDTSIVLTLSGVDTTATSLAWCMYELARNPVVQQKAYEEIVSVIGEAGNENPDKDPSYLSRLPYLTGFVEKSLRLYPVASVLSRRLEQDTVINGYNIPAETDIVIWLVPVATCSENFNEPFDFTPEWWIREKFQEKIRLFSFLPFGFGVRSGLGRCFAMIELVTGMTRVLQTFHLEYIGSEYIKGIIDVGLLAGGKELPIKFINRV